MFKKILIPTDGSKIARKAIRAGIALAKKLKASVVGYHAAEPVDLVFNAEMASIRPMAIQQFQQRIAEQGQDYLAEIAKACKAAGVVCETVMTTSAKPYQGIVDAARKKKCDMIMMASHGRGELATQVLGSVTQKVLAHTKIQLLV